MSIIDLHVLYFSTKLAKLQGKLSSVWQRYKLNIVLTMITVFRIEDMESKISHNLNFRLRGNDIKCEFRNAMFTRNPQSFFSLLDTV
ncbi:MAG TPA: hypothetical protein DEP08_01540 [Candidatus Jacksonbacteria bacterium]|nr:hypothetical protein [Candidatus Jacksonbacteria bacterium]